MGRQDALTTVADDRVLDLEAKGARALFAYGPPRTIDDPDRRMVKVLAALDSEVIAIRWAEQIHGTLVASIEAEPGRTHESAACVGRCDALITADPGLALVVWTADCVPILVAGDGVVAAVHSGWRGSVADIGGAVVRRFEIEYGVPPDHLQILLGPAISGPRYEVSREVIHRLGALGVAEDQWLADRHVDLRGFLKGRFEHLGVNRSSIRIVGPCTASTPELASYRRDGVEAGRQWSLIYRTSESR
jgi:YfiH family protein